jgi:hypothetical protein
MDGFVTVFLWLDSYCHGYELGDGHGSPGTCILSFLFCLHTFDTSALSEQGATFLLRPKDTTCKRFCLMRFAN